MSGAMEITLSGDAQLGQRLEWLTKDGKRELLSVIGAELEAQTRRRILHEKRSPNGFPWMPWSPKYAKTRHPGQSLLEAKGHLLDSIGWEVTADDSVKVGSNLVYAAIHQFGGWDVDMPWIVARPYLGVSKDNERELAGVITDFFQRRLAA